MKRDRNDLPEWDSTASAQPGMPDIKSDQQSHAVPEEDASIALPEPNGVTPPSCLPFLQGLTTTIEDQCNEFEKSITKALSHLKAIGDWLQAAENALDRDELRWWLKNGFQDTEPEGGLDTFTFRRWTSFSNEIPKFLEVFQSTNRWDRDQIVSRIFTDWKE